MHMTSDMKPSMFTVEIYDRRDREWDLVGVDPSVDALEQFAQSSFPGSDFRIKHDRGAEVRTGSFIPRKFTMLADK